MNDIHIVYGTKTFEFVVLPTIVVTTSDGSYKFITIEWMRWYIGFAWDSV